VNVYPFIEAQKAGGHHVVRACALLEVSRSAYYAQRGSRPSARERADAELLAEVQAVHTASGGTYGSLRVHADGSPARVTPLMRSGCV
jgi:hypothetical protein